MDLGYSQFIKRLQDKAIDNGKLVIQADNGLHLVKHVLIVDMSTKISNFQIESGIV